MPYRSDPYANLGSTFNDLTRNLLTLRGQSMQQALSEAELQMRGNQFQETRRHNAAIEELARGKDPDAMPLSRVDLLKSKIGFKSSLGLDDKDLEDIYAPMMEMSGMPRGQAYDMLKAQGPDLRNIILQRVSGVYEKKLSDPEKGPLFAQSPQAKAMKQFIDALDGDAGLSRTIDGLFPDVARMRRVKDIELAARTREGYDTVTLYGPQGQAQRFSVPKGSSYELPAGWSDKPPTDDEREYMRAKNEGFKGSFTDWQVKMKKAGASNITLSTGATTQLQKDIIEQQTQIDTLSTIDQMFKPEYLTYYGRGKQFAGKVGEKLGTQVIDEQWLADRSTWYQITKQNQIAFRKWATGVAGSAKELEEIARAYPDPDKNSPTEFVAMLKQAKANAVRLKKRYNMFLMQGITPTKEQLSAVPLSSIPVDESELAGGISEAAQRFLIEKGLK